MPGIALPKTLSGYRPQDVGLLTHAALAIVAPALGTIPADRVAEYVLDVTGGLVNGTNVNRRRTLQQTAAGHVCTYLRRLAPSAPWRVLQAEFQTGFGRTDLAWTNPATGEMFFDELKTHKGALTGLSEEVFEQAKRQANGGDQEFSDQFLGVRVVPFGSLHLISMVTAAGERVALNPTPDEPLRRRDESEGGAA